MATPPGWAEQLLRLFLAPADFDSVSGDLLEAYREDIHPERGQSASDSWYIVQVLGFVTRKTGVWAALFACVFVGRTALDWLAPPSDFYARSMASSSIQVGLLMVVGLWASWRAHSFIAGTVAAVATTVIAAFISTIGDAVLLAIWHDTTTLAAIDGSGGLSEVFELPVMLILPAIVVGTIGGAVGVAVRKLTLA